MVKLYDRKTKTYEIEKVAGGSCINWMYSSPVGMNFLEIVIKKRIASKICGGFCNRAISRGRIKKFIDNLNINMTRFVVPEGGYKNFNEFFSRKLNKEKFYIEKDMNILISPCDSKVLAYNNIDINSLVQVKGITYSLKELIGEESVARNYENGTCIIFRLSPTDYHRFHFVDDGICSKTSKIKGFYYSVNPTALNKINKLFCENKREWSILHSENFDDIIYVEVGATFVGSIIQTYKENEKVRKGDEKGYFKFGGSTVILFFRKGIINVDEDILEQTSNGIECLVHIGDKIGVKIK